MPLGTLSPRSPLRLLQHAALLVATAVPVGVLVGQTLEETNEQIATLKNVFVGLEHYSSKDCVQAIKPFRLAAEQGDATAQFYLGVMYDNGEGVPQDYAEAVKWYRLAAEQGYASAQFNLGLMYGLGQGVPQDYAEAVKWYRLAAEQGNDFGQFNLGLMYRLGQGVPQDYARAHKWFNLAASRASAEKNKEYASGRDLVGKLMTPAQIAEAQRLAREWKPKTWEELKGQVTQ